MCACWSSRTSAPWGLRSYLFKVAGNLRSTECGNSNRGRSRIGFSDIDDFLDKLTARTNGYCAGELVSTLGCCRRAPREVPAGVPVHRLEDQPFDEIAREMDSRSACVAAT